MSKRSIFAGLKSAADQLFTPDFAKEREALANEVAELEGKAALLQRQHGQLVLDVRRDLPGSAEKLGMAVDELRATQDALKDAKAALEASEAQDEAQQAERSAQAAARQDKDSQAAFDRLADVARRHQDNLLASTATFKELQDAQSACRALFVENPRLRDDGMLIGLTYNIVREITRQAVAAGLPPQQMPPGADPMTLTTDPSAWPTLAQHYADLAKSIFRTRH